MLTRSTRSGATSYARDRLTGLSLHLTRSQPLTHGCSLITHGCRLYAQGLANVAPPLVLDTAAAAEQRPQQVGTRPLLRATPRHPCLPGADAILPQLPPLPPRAGAGFGASQLGSPASLGWHGWLRVTRRTLEERPYRAEPRQGHTYTRLGARCGS